MPRPALITAALCVLLSLAGAPPAAQTVTLRSADGSLSLRGDLKEFDGETYIIETAVGPIPIAAAGVSCLGEACPAEEAPADTFRILVSRGLDQGLVLALVESFSLFADTDIQIRPVGPERTEVTLTRFDGGLEATIAIQPTDTARAFEGLAISESTIAFTNRQITPGEVQVVAALGHGDPRAEGRQIVAALDGVVFVTAPGNPTGTLREAEIAAVLAGQIANWSELGGEDAPINVYVPAAETGTQAVLEEQILGPAGLGLGRGVAILPTDAQVSDRVTADPFGFGATTYSSLRSTEPLLIAGDCGLPAAPSPFAIKAEEYPYTKRIYLYRSGREAGGSVARFLDFLATDEAQEVIRDAGYVDQRVAGIGLGAQGLRLANAISPADGEVSLAALQDLVAELAGAERLSLTLRFDTGATGFDARARADMRRLAAMIGEGRLDGQEVLLLGFTDGLGQAAENRALSRARAEAAAAELRALLPPETADSARILPMGFGELAPLACDETEEGRRINRRVEVWTRPVLR